MLADSTIEVEGRADRGGREEYEERADGSARAYQVSQARCSARRITPGTVKGLYNLETWNAGHEVSWKGRK